jgi:hypothetical protein
MSDKFYQEEMWALVNALLTCPKFKTEKDRDDVLSLMPRISGRVKRTGDNTSDALNIVQACVDIANGIDELLKQLKGFDGETIYFPEVETAAKNLKARLSPPEPPPPEPPSPPIALQQEPKFALVIGISNYPPHFDAEHKPLPQRQFTPLQCAANDAVELSKFLSETAHYSVEGTLIDEDATLAGIMHALDELCRKCQASGVSDPTLLIYFSGHGACDAAGRSYLVPYDAHRDRLFATALWSKTLDSALNELRTSRLAVFLDACHAEAIGAVDAEAIGPARTKDAGGVPFDPNSIAPVTASGRFVVASCMAGQRSYEDDTAKHGIFTHHLLELLRCKDPDALPEEIELWDLYGVLKTKVMKTAQGRRPAIVQEPFANFQSSTGVVLAINEPLRENLLRRKLDYLQALCALILPLASGQPPRIVHNRPRKIEDMLTTYCRKGVRRPGFDAFYAVFDENSRYTDPEDDATVEWECQSLIDKFEDLERGTSSRLPPRVQAVGSAPSAGVGPRTVAMAGPQPTDEAPDRRRQAEVPVGPIKPLAPAFAREPDLLPSVSASSGGPRRSLGDADAEYILEDIYSYPLLFTESNDLRRLLVRSEGIVQKEVTVWLINTATTAVSEEDWVRIRKSIASRFLEKWKSAKEIRHTSTLDSRVDSGG